MAEIDHINKKAHTAFINAFLNNATNPGAPVFSWIADRLSRWSTLWYTGVSS